MKLIKTELEDCYIIEPDRFGDDRGYFSPDFIQNNLKLLFRKTLPFPKPFMKRNWSYSQSRFCKQTKAPVQRRKANKTDKKSRFKMHPTMISQHNLFQIKGLSCFRFHPFAR